MPTHATEETSTSELLDGTVILLRPLTPEDETAVVELYESLTDDDRYFRFFTLQPTHLREKARLLTDSPAAQCSIGAFSAGRLLGVANYATSDAPNVAEVAVVVAHDQHLRGVGTALLRQLATVGRDNGLQRFVGDILWENHLMLRLVTDAGWPCTRQLEDGVIHVEIDLRRVDQRTGN
jgi:hypothetical protein